MFLEFRRVLFRSVEMKASLIFCLLALLTVGWVNADGSSEESKQKNRRHSCGGLVEEPPKTPSPSTVSVPAPTSVPTPAPGQCYCTPESPTEGPGSGEGSGEGNFHSHCILIEAFYNMSFSLTVQQQVLWEAWIVEIEQSILAQSNYTSDEKVVLISISLKKFFKRHGDIYKLLGYKKIAGWGTCKDFVYVSISIQIEITLKVVTVDGSNSCGLVEALRNASSSPECGCSSQDQDDLESLIEEILAILGDASYSYEQQLAVVSDLFEAFFESHVSLKEFLLEVHIEGYGSIESLLQVCKTYKKVTTLSLAISGSSNDDCALLAALDEASKNSSFTGSEQLQIIQLHGKLQLFFKSTTDLKLRLEYVSSQCHELFKLADFIIKIIEEVSCVEWDGDVYDLIFCAGICRNHGCGNPNNGSGPQVESTSAAPSSAPTTVQTPADCNKCPDLIFVDGQNKTILTEVLLSHYSTWTLSKKSGFNSCFNQIRKAIWDNVAFPNVPAKLLGCRNAFKGYSTNNVAIQDEVFNIQITGWMGTIRQFVACA